MMRYSLRTLVLLAILGPPALAGVWIFGAKAIADYRARQSVVIWEEVRGPGAVFIYEGSLCTLTIDDSELAASEIED